MNATMMQAIQFFEAFTDKMGRIRLAENGRTSSNYLIPILGLALLILSPIGLSGQAASKTLIVFTAEDLSGEDFQQLSLIHEELLAQGKNRYLETALWVPKLNDEACSRFERCRETYEGADVHGILIITVARVNAGMVLKYGHYNIDGSVLSRDSKPVIMDTVAAESETWFVLMVAPIAERSGLLAFYGFDENAIVIIDGILLTPEEKSAQLPLTVGRHELRIFTENEAQLNAIVEIDSNRVTDVHFKDLERVRQEQPEIVYAGWPAVVTGAAAVGLFGTGLVFVVDIISNNQNIENQFNDQTIGEGDLLAVARQPEIINSRKNIYLDSWMLTTLWGGSALLALASSVLTGYYLTSQFGPALED
jgi:hypothetical protein